MKTRDRILETAEVLFARHGYAGTSLREITERADVNVAAVNYHFGSKEGLLTAILDRVIAPINQERLRLLREVSADGEPDLTEVLTAFLLPDLESINELRGRNPALPRFVARMYSEGSPLMEEVIGSQFAAMSKEFGEAFSLVLPDLSEEEIAYRVSCVVGIVVYMFASVEAPGMARLASGDIEHDLARLLAITTSIMAAPVREVTAT